MQFMLSSSNNFALLCQVTPTERPLLQLYMNTQRLHSLCVWLPESQMIHSLIKSGQPECKSLHIWYICLPIRLESSQPVCIKNKSPTGFTDCYSDNPESQRLHSLLVQLPRVPEVFHSLLVYLPESQRLHCLLVWYHCPGGFTSCYSGYHSPRCFTTCQSDYLKNKGFTYGTYVYSYIQRLHIMFLWSNKVPEASELVNLSVWLHSHRGSTEYQSSYQESQRRHTSWLAD